jgi:hypothetical protein
MKETRYKDAIREVKQFDAVAAGFTSERSGW